MNKLKAEALLKAAQESQTKFWADLKALEDELGCEVESTKDLQEWTVAALLTEEGR